MLPLTDPKWKTLEGGYRIPYDASVPLEALEAGANVWDELWQELHHQGDVGVASYAVVPHLVRIAFASASRDWNFYGLVATIEIERHRKGNPSIPEWLNASYVSAWAQLLQIATADLSAKIDEFTLRAILSVIALAKGDLKLGAFIANLDTSELDELLEETVGWSDRYG